MLRDDQTAKIYFYGQVIIQKVSYPKRFIMQKVLAIANLCKITEMTKEALPKCKLKTMIKETHTKCKLKTS